MNNEVKICLYLKNREKPVILTDTVTNEDTYDNKVEFFRSAMTGENKIVTIDFMNDNLIFNMKDIDAVVISKPSVGKNEELIVSADDDLGLSRDEIKESTPLDLGKNEDEDDITDLDADEDDDKSVDIVED